jgi:uncharacterized FlaG/YvyC family protein
MEIEPISSSGATSERWLDLWAQRLQARARAETNPEAKAPAPQANEPSTDGLDVEIAEHAATGAQTVRLVDSDSGEVVCQIPHQQVLDLVASLIKQHEADQRGGRIDGEH